MAKKKLGLTSCTHCGALEQTVFDDGRKCILICDKCGVQTTWQRKAARAAIIAKFEKTDKTDGLPKPEPVSKESEATDNTDKSEWSPESVKPSVVNDKSAVSKSPIFNMFSRGVKR